MSERRAEQDRQQQSGAKEARITVIDEKSLEETLGGKRWFGGGDRTVERVSVVDQAVLDDGPPALLTALADVHFTDGESSLYHLSLLVEEDGSCTDVFEDVDRLRILGDLMAHGTSIKGERGTFHYGGPGLDPMSPPGARSAWAVGAEQSNSSVVLDDDIIVKLFRRIEAGPNPDLEINRMLTSEGFPFVPAQVGEISYEREPDGDDPAIDLGIAQKFVGDSEEGWTHLLGHIRRLYDEIHEHDVAEDLRELTEERASKSLRLLEELGHTTASMHVAMAREETEPDFAPEPVTQRDVEEWASDAESALRAAIRSVDYGMGRVEDAITERIASLRSLVPDLLGSKVRIHGDYHLGQVLRGPREWLVIDFEGEPLRPLEYRRQKQSPLKDVAGMLRSLSYVVTAVLFERAQPDQPEWGRLAPWTDSWEDLARERFLSSYLATSHEGHFLPADRDDLAVALDVFEVDKALYELRYERTHRPDWARIPMRGIERIVNRGKSR